jgi:hypothetical protein
LLELGLGYYVVCEALTAMTVGKRIVGIRVVAEDGEYVGLGAAVVRNLLPGGRSILLSGRGARCAHFFAWPAARRPRSGHARRPPLAHDKPRAGVDAASFDVVATLWKPSPPDHSGRVERAIRRMRRGDDRLCISFA